MQYDEEAEMPYDDEEEREEIYDDFMNLRDYAHPAEELDPELQRMALVPDEAPVEPRPVEDVRDEAW